MRFLVGTCSSQYIIEADSFFEAVDSLYTTEPEYVIHLEDDITLYSDKNDTKFTVSAESDDGSKVYFNEFFDFNTAIEMYNELKTDSDYDRVSIEYNE